MMISRHLVTLPRVVLGLVLAYAGATKLGDGHGFSALIANYRVMPAQLNQALAVMLPWIEVASGTMLVLGLWTRPAALIAATLMAAFAAGVTQALFRGLDIECGCFETGAGATIGIQTLAIEILCFVAALYIATKADEHPHAESEAKAITRRSA